MKICKNNRDKWFEKVIMYILNNFNVLRDIHLKKNTELFFLQYALGTVDGQDNWKSITCFTNS